MTLDWRRCMSAARFGAPAEDPTVARTPFQRDYDRVLFSGAFRRLADKTQVFPLPYDDHVHSRLTHSLEVASIGRSLGTLVGDAVLKLDTSLRDSLDARDFGDCVSAACLAHDIGNPPFGHVGEAAIREFFLTRQPFWSELSDRQQKDLENFEGNAQTFRIVTRLERPSRGGGLALSQATIGALVKYPCSSRVASDSSTVKATKKPGLFDGDVEPYRDLAASLGLPQLSDESWARHPLALLTEAADDIAYLLLDLEDGLRLKQVPFDLFVKCLEPLCEGDTRASSLASPSDYSERMDRADLLRAVAVNTLIHDAAETFLRELGGISSGDFTTSLEAGMSHRASLKKIKEVCVKHCYEARDVLKMELSGAEAIQGLLDIFVDSFTHPNSLRGKHLSTLYSKVLQPGSAYERLQRLTDHVSGMTDHYAVRLYRELRGMRYPGGRD
jgi:dGTPase